MRVAGTAGGLGCLMVVWLGCDKDTGARMPSVAQEMMRETFDVPGLQFSIPRLRGWAKDPSVSLSELSSGGPALKLHRPGAPAGSAKITVIVDPKRDPPASLEGVLDKNLHDMAKLEEDGSVRFTRVEHGPVRIGPRRAFKVRHEYTATIGDAPLAFVQLGVLTVLDGRGLAVMATGRYELFNPLEKEIERILDGVSLGERSTLITPVSP